MTIERLDEMLSVRGGTLFVEEISTLNLARGFGTPVNILSEDQIRRNLRRIHQAFAASWPGKEVRLLPSEKACFNLAVTRILVSEGAGCDTFGQGELFAALRSGMRPELISVNGTGKDKPLVRKAVAAGARITLDSAHELDLVIQVAQELSKVANVRLRVRPDYAGLNEDSEFRLGSTIQEAANSYKPGIPLDQIVDVGARALHLPQVKLTGLMVHLGRHRTETEVWRKMAVSFGRLVGELCRLWDGWRPLDLDLGGGYGAPRDPTSLTHKPAPPIEEIGQAMTTALAEELTKAGVPLQGITLELEPGRSLFASAGVHLTSVRHVKQQAQPNLRRWIETDTSEVFLPDLFAEHATFRPFFASRAGASLQGTADIVGISCNFDVLSADLACPLLEAGDLLAFLDTGAYQDAGASNFNALPRPGVVLVTGDQAEWIKRPEQLEDVFARDIIPARLAR
jgi:diaminopimelate decarboxylase